MANAIKSSIDCKNLASDFDVIHFFNHRLKKEEHFYFFYEVSIRVIESLSKGRYTDFDAHTTSNCCHGMALLACRLIQNVQKLDLEKISASILNKKNSPDVIFANTDHSLFIALLPREFLLLLCVYLLKLSSSFIPELGIRVIYENLKQISNVANAFCIKMIKTLQKEFSKAIAHSYFNYACDLPSNFSLSNIPTSKWGKYVHPSMLRKDKRGVLYASCIFSTQVILAYLSHNKERIGVFHETIDQDKQIIAKKLILLEGTGNGFREVLQEEVSSKDQNKPIIIFGAVGQVSQDKKYRKQSVRDWIPNFQDLVLADNAFYPQFPKVKDDPSFDSSSIIPVEKELQEKIQAGLSVEGVSKEDPSFCLFTHIYPASIKEFFNVSSLPDVTRHVQLE